MPMKSICTIASLSLLLLTPGVAGSHGGLVDGYGCHSDPKQGNYHCHQGPYAGQSFPSRDVFLRQLRSPKSKLPQPKTDAPPPEKPTLDDLEDRNRP
jgi:hypothetical protein